MFGLNSVLHMGGYGSGYLMYFGILLISIVALIVALVGAIKTKKPAYKFALIVIIIGLLTWFILEQ